MSNNLSISYWNNRTDSNAIEDEDAVAVSHDSRRLDNNPQGILQQDFNSGEPSSMQFINIRYFGGFLSTIFILDGASSHEHLDQSQFPEESRLSESGKISNP
jgi:hypothetical protein